MELTRWEPSKLMADLLDDMWSPFGGRQLAFGRQPTRPFEADVVELGDEIQVTAELPGMSRENLDHLMDRWWGRFSRSFSLPRKVNQDGVQASFEDGILTIRVPKTEDSRRRPTFEGRTP